MGETMRSEISKKNKYWISSNRFRELKYLCLQYKELEQLYADLLEDSAAKGTTIGAIRTDGIFTDHVAETAIALANCENLMSAIRTSCEEADEFLSNYIFKAVTEGCSYNNLVSMHGLPCCKEVFYRSLHKFYYILHRKLWFAE